jgi:hypothetical protein
MTEVSAFLGAQPRAGPPRDVSTSRGGVSTTFQSCQSLAVGAVSPNKGVMRRISAQMGTGIEKNANRKINYERLPGRTGMRATPILLLAALSSFLAPSALSAAELVLNGDFTTDNFTDWTLFTTSRGTLGPRPYPRVVMFYVTRSERQDAAEFNVGEVSYPSGRKGGGIYQDITTTSGTLDLSASFASYNKIAENFSAGVFSLLLDGTTLATDNLGPISAHQRLRGSFSVSTPVTAGSHELEILITRPYQSCGRTCTPNEYVTEISATMGGGAESSTMGVAVIPESSTWTMMLAGFAGLGVVAYRRRNADSGARFV